MHSKKFSDGELLKLVADAPIGQRTLARKLDVSQPAIRKRAVALQEEGKLSTIAPVALARRDDLKATAFPSIREREVMEERGFTWDELLDQLEVWHTTLTIPSPRDTKEQATFAKLETPAIYFGTYDGEGIEMPNVRSIYVVGLDVDGMDDDEFARLYDASPIALFDHAVFTTYSHHAPYKGGKGSFRILIPLAYPLRDLTKAEWYGFRTNLLNYLGLPSDDGAKDYARRFYVPATAGEGYEEGGHFFLRHRGSRGFYPTHAPPEPSLVDFGKHYRGKYVDEVRKIARGEPWGDPKEDGSPEEGRYPKLRGVSFAAANWCPSATYEEWEAWVAPAIAADLATYPDDPASADEKVLRQLWETAVGRVREEREEDEDIREALVGASLEEHDGDALETHFAAFGFSDAAQLKQNLVLVDRANYYLARSYGRYRPVGKDPAATAQDVLEFCQDWGLPWQVPQGNNRMRARKLTDLADWARPLVHPIARHHGLAHDYVTFDEGHPVLHTRASFIQHEPEWSDEVDGWLRALCPDEGSYEALCAWLGYVADTSLMLPVLYLHGGHNVGKSLFAKGVASIFGEALADGRVIASSYGDALLRTPVVYIDENAPSMRSSPYPNFLDALRVLTTENKHNVNKKYGSIDEVRGFLRFVLTANHLGMLSHDLGDQGRASLEAVADRVLVVHCSDEAKRYLDALPRKASKLTYLVEDGIFARHVAQLAEWADQPDDGRFAVPGNLDPDSAMMMDRRAAIVLKYLAAGHALCKASPTSPVSDSMGYRVDEDGASWVTYAGFEKWVEDKRLFSFADGVKPRYLLRQYLVHDHAGARVQQKRGSARWFLVNTEMAREHAAELDIDFDDPELDDDDAMKGMVH